MKSTLGIRWQWLAQVIALATAASLLAQALAAPSPDPRESDVLVIDFIGLNDESPLKHARQFTDAILPEANISTFGFHGIQKPDDQRLADGYQRIFRSDTEAERDAAANAVLDYATGHRTVLAFDFNEKLIPQQLRGDQPDWLPAAVSKVPVLGPWLAGGLVTTKTLPNKIQDPAMVAAMAAERWVKAHPGGVLILRGHSDGTYAESYIYDYLMKRGIAPAAVILESPRQPFNHWQERAKANTQTKFISVTANADLSRATIFDKGYRHAADLGNWINYNIAGFFNPLRAHGIVTKYSKPETIQRTDRRGEPILANAELGQLIRKDLVDRFVSIRNDTVGAGKPAGRQDKAAMPSEDREDRSPKKPLARTDLGLGLPPSAPGADASRANIDLAMKPGAAATATLGKDRPANLGGIDPNAKAAATISAMSHVDAVVVDPTSGRLILLTEGAGAKSAPVDSMTFALALWSVFADKQLAFSLDPADPSNPNGEWLKAVYYPEESAGLAPYLYEGDVLLKMFSFGVEQKGGRIVARPAGPLPSLPQMMEKEPRPPGHNWTRNWIVPERIELSGTDGVVKVQVKMAVKARRQTPDPKSKTGLRDIETDPKSIEARWARRTTELYEQLANDTAAAPQWAQIAELSKALAIAHWLHDSGAKVDVNALISMLNAGRERAVDKMPAINVTFRRDDVQPYQQGNVRGTRTVTHQLHLFGGVDPNGKPQLTEDQRMVSLRKAVLAALPAAPDAGPFEVRDGRHRYMASALPFRVEMGPVPAYRGSTVNRLLGKASVGPKGCARADNAGASCLN